ncbi:MAG: YraN family protein [Planctomycetes bacterium]|nr:YraN family protein [Planctomycetota bacterium]
MPSSLLAALRRILSSAAAGEHRDLGRRGEAAAERELDARGYRVLARRFRAAGGELDLVAVRDGVISFVEVKANRPGTGYDGAQRLDAGKRRRIARAAQAFVASRRLEGAPCRFDLALATVDGDRWQVEIREGVFEV